MEPKIAGNKNSGGQNGSQKNTDTGKAKGTNDTEHERNLTNTSTCLSQGGIW